VEDKEPHCQRCGRRRVLRFLWLIDDGCVLALPPLLAGSLAPCHGAQKAYTESKVSHHLPVNASRTRRSLRHLFIGGIGPCVAISTMRAAAATEGRGNIFMLAAAGRT
jgi:hypothetical protein